MDEEVIQVLMIEDDEEDYVLTREHLADATALRFECEWMDQLEKGISYLAENKVDLVLLDLNMPDSQGLETLLRLRSRYQDLPIVVLTAAPEQDTAMIAIKQGAQDYLVKGRVDRDGLVRAIRYALERTRTDAALRRYRDHLEELVTARTSEVRKANEQLEREVAERNRAEEEKLQLERQLLEARKLEAVGRLAAGVAHEYNNALTVIMGYGELLLERLDDDDALRLDINEVLRAAERAASMTYQLLAFSRKQVVRLKVMEANHLVTGAMAIVQPLLPDSVEVEAIVCEEPAYVRLDQSHVEQIFRNLALNARDAMPGGGIFRMSVENVLIDEASDSTGVAGRYVCVSVQDSGSGMDTDTLEHIFEPFFSTKSVGHGTGLGLSVVYGIMKQHNGWVEASSSKGGGSSFRLFFPAATADLELLPGEKHAHHAPLT